MVVVPIHWLFEARFKQARLVEFYSISMLVVWSYELSCTTYFVPICYLLWAMATLKWKFNRGTGRAGNAIVFDPSFHRSGLSVLTRWEALCLLSFFSFHNRQLKFICVAKEKAEGLTSLTLKLYFSLLIEEVHLNENFFGLTLKWNLEGHKTEPIVSKWKLKTRPKFTTGLTWIQLLMS